jgi:hypothetical protein
LVLAPPPPYVTVIEEVVLAVVYQTAKPVTATTGVQTWLEVSLIVGVLAPLEY